MVIFQVLHNGEVIQQLPLQPEESLHVGVSWMDYSMSEEHRERLRLLSLRDDHDDRGEMRTHCRWNKVDLQVGDEVMVRIIECADDTPLTPPDYVLHRHPEDRERHLRKRYEELKARFEGGAEPK